MDIGSTIKNIRKQKGLTQQEFARLCDIAQTYVSQIERNEKEPNISMMKKIARKVKIPLPILLFLSMTKEDVQPDKLKDFLSLNPSLKSLINDIFKV